MAEAPAADAEQYVLVVRLAGTPPRYVIERSAKDAPPRLLTMDPPHPDEGIEAAVRSLFWTRLGLQLDAAPVLGEPRAPGRVRLRRMGRDGTGWRRAVAAVGRGELDRALAVRVEIVDPPGVLAALSTDWERAIFRDGMALLGDALGEAPSE